MNHYFERNKAIHVITLILERYGSCNLQFLFELLYFCDRQSLLETGTSILDEEYSYKFNCILPINVSFLISSLTSWNEYFELIYDKNKILLKNSNRLDLDLFSDYEIELIDNVLDKYTDVQQTHLDLLNLNEIKCLNNLNEVIITYEHILKSNFINDITIQEYSKLHNNIVDFRRFIEIFNNQ